MEKGEVQRLIEISPEEDHVYPKHTKEYMLKQGFKPYRTRSGRIRWINSGNAAYKRIRTRKQNIFYRTDPLGMKIMRTWCKVLLTILISVLIISFLFFRLKIHQYFI